MSSHFEFQQWIEVPLETVFLFFADPRNLPRIMPPGLGTRLTALRVQPAPANQAVTNCDHLAGAGSEIKTSFRMLPFFPLRAKWTALITEFEWNHHFADVQKSGPFKSFHHRHEFAAEKRDTMNGTMIRDIIDLDVGFGLVGQVALKIAIARQFKSIFLYRQQALSRLLAIK